MTKSAVAKPDSTEYLYSEEQCKMQIRIILSLSVAVCVFAAATHSIRGAEISNAGSNNGNTATYPVMVQNVGIHENTAYTVGMPLFLSFEDKDREYEESQLRRFEIIFFISLPVSLFFSFAGAAAFKAAAEGEIRFSSLDYSYILLSSVGVSFTIALRDNRTVYRKGTITQEQR